MLIDIARSFLVVDQAVPIADRQSGLWALDEHDRICEFRSLTRPHPAPWSERMGVTVQLPAGPRSRPTLRATSTRTRTSAAYVR
jgi:hypothetical protein